MGHVGCMRACVWFRAWSDWSDAERLQVRSSASWDWRLSRQRCSPGSGRRMARASPAPQSQDRSGQSGPAFGSCRARLETADFGEFSSRWPIGQGAAGQVKSESRFQELAGLALRSWQIAFGLWTISGCPLLSHFCPPGRCEGDLAEVDEARELVLRRMPAGNSACKAPRARRVALQCLRPSVRSFFLNVIF